MKNMQKKKAEWMQQGHGEYSEIPEEKEFFNITKNSQNVVCHFYREETFRFYFILMVSRSIVLWKIYEPSFSFFLVIFLARIFWTPS